MVVSPSTAAPSAPASAAPSAPLDEPGAGVHDAAAGLAEFAACCAALPPALLGVAGRAAALATGATAVTTAASRARLAAVVGLAEWPTPLVDLRDAATLPSDAVSAAARSVGHAAVSAAGVLRRAGGDATLPAPRVGGRLPLIPDRALALLAGLAAYGS